MQEININIEMLKKGEAEFYEFEPNALVFKKQWIAAAAGAAPGVGEIAAPKIFTGIVSQGVLGDAAQFAVRPDDIIDSPEDLRIAALNNLALFLAAVPGRIIYELKIVASVIGKDGIRRTGSTQTIITGYTTAGQPKKKTIHNKFAVLNLFLFTAKNTRTKIDSLILGPVDSAAFQITPQAVAAIGDSLRTQAVTTNISEISTIRTDQAISVQSPASIEAYPTVITTVPPEATAAEQRLLQSNYVMDDSFFLPGDGFGGYLYRIINGKLYHTVPTDHLFTIEERKIMGNFEAQYKKAAEILRLVGVNVDTMRKVPYIADVITQTPQGGYLTLEEFLRSAPLGTNPRKCEAKTIAEFYDAERKNYPTVTERGKIYEDLGLGPGVWYTGTAEQNIKLLAELKRRSGC